jgi:hypothetical protein
VNQTVKYKMMKSLYKIVCLFLALAFLTPVIAQQKQEPVKQEEKKSTKKDSTSVKKDSASGTQKMAITEQGVNKTKKTQKSSLTDTTKSNPKKK